MYRFTCYFHVSEKEGFELRTPSNAKHVLSIECLDEDTNIERLAKLDIFARKCDKLKKALCEIYPFVSLTKVRTQVTNFHNFKKH